MPPNTRTLKGQSYSTKRWANLAWPKGSKLSGFSTYADFVNMEAALGEKNVRGDIKFIVSPSAKAVLKSTAKNQNSFIMEGNEVNGYPVLCTSAVAGKGIVYGNFADLVIGQWGGIDLTVDPYTQAANGKVRLVINAYFDAKPRRADAFVKKVLKA